MHTQYTYCIQYTHIQYIHSSDVIWALEATVTIILLYILQHDIINTLSHCHTHTHVQSNFPEWHMYYCIIVLSYYTVCMNFGLISRVMLSINCSVTQFSRYNRCTTRRILTNRDTCSFTPVPTTTAPTWAVTPTPKPTTCPSLPRNPWKLEMESKVKACLGYLLPSVNGGFFNTNWVDTC